MTSRNIRFASFDGVELEGTLVVPNGGDFQALAVLSPGIEVDREEQGFYTKLAEFLERGGVTGTTDRDPSPS